MYVLLFTFSEGTYNIQLKDDEFDISLFQLKMKSKHLTKEARKTDTKFWHQLRGN